MCSVVFREHLTYSCSIEVTITVIRSYRPNKLLGKLITIPINIGMPSYGIKYGKTKQSMKYDYNTTEQWKLQAELWSLIKYKFNSIEDLNK